MMPMNEQISYEALIEPIEKQMIAVVWKIVRDPTDFDDAFQEATIKVWKALPKIVKHPNPHGLILRICINAAFDELRRKNRRRKRELTGEIAERLATQDCGPIEREQRDRLLDAIAGLPRKQAESLLMRFLEGMPYPAIALAMDCAESTVRTHIQRGCEKLHHILSDLASV